MSTVHVVHTCDIHMVCVCSKAAITHSCIIAKVHARTVTQLMTFMSATPNSCTANILHASTEALIHVLMYKTNASVCCDTCM